MAPSNIAPHQEGPADTVRSRLLSALHVGRLRPGQRVMSVRRLAHMIGVNRKAVHRAYTELAREGFLEVRPGSGTFVTERQSGAVERPSTPSLLATLDRIRRDASRMGISPAVLSRFVQIVLVDGLHDVRVGIVECNGDQIAMIGHDLAQHVGHVRPMLLGKLERDPHRALSGLRSVVTTDCHYGQVKALLHPFGVQIYTVTLDDHFPRSLLRLAERDDVYIVAADERFRGVFRRLLGEIVHDEGELERIQVLHAARAWEALVDAPRGAWVSCSPLVAPVVAATIPGHLRRVDWSWRVAPGALETVRAGLAFDLALHDAS